MSLPCGKCIGCYQRRAREWRARACHEASLHEHNAFVTLTYNRTWLPDDGNLRPHELTKFIWRLRKALRAHSPGLLGERVRFLACGEYGENFGRPHFHALLFGVGFDDGKIWKKDLYTSAALSALWRKGNATYGAVTPASAAYLAGYTMKQIDDRSVAVTPDGEVKQRPFLRCSNRPGIGFGWLAKYKQDLQHGYCVVAGQQEAVPRYYQQKMKELYADLAETSREAAAEHAATVRQSPLELEAGERIAKRRFELMNPRPFTQFREE